MQKRILLVFGTRPEAIKMAPLYHGLKKNRAFQVKACSTGQHREMMDQVLDFFEIKPDFELKLMRPGQSLFHVTSRGLERLEPVMRGFSPDLIIVQGDTTTAFVGALSAYYCKTKVAHLEAGLRSGDKLSPFPEEINRTLIGHLADYHFAPTPEAKKNLLREGIRKNVFVVGNTVVDALLLGQQLIAKNKRVDYARQFKGVDFSKKLILVTVHRRESFGKPYEEICRALTRLSKMYADEIEMIFPLHLNPNVRSTARAMLKGSKNIHMIEPLDYANLLWMMKRSYMILTDSGGIQEEAPSFGKPVLVLREVTERVEGIRAGTAKLVGADFTKIVRESKRLLENPAAYRRMSTAHNPYGDGKTVQRIIKILLKKH